MLKAMIREKPAEARANFSIYNFGATAEEKLIATGGSVEESLKQAYIQYHRTINTDDELAEALACELMWRDPNLGLSLDETCAGVRQPNNPRDHVVLLLDWDTVYGNDLSRTVVRTFSGTASGKEIDPKWIRQVSYLRGFDGRLPEQKYAGQTTPSQSDNAEQKPAGQAAANQQQAATPETASQFESAEGQSQFDYLRRLAADLRARDAVFRRTDGGHIAAVGILGGDVYDKLLILQALRPELPGSPVLYERSRRLVAATKEGALHPQPAGRLQFRLEAQ